MIEEHNLNVSVNDVLTVALTRLPAEEQARVRAACSTIRSLIKERNRRVKIGPGTVLEIACAIGCLLDGNGGWDDTIVDGLGGGEAAADLEKHGIQPDPVGQTAGRSVWDGWCEWMRLI